MIGITERGDAALDLSWKSWVNQGLPAILITKDPQKLYSHITQDMNIIVHCTITGYGGSILEPNVPLPSTNLAIKGYYDICTKIGSNRVVLRIDPIIPTEKGLRVAISILKQFQGGSRIRISFLDMYEHIKDRFTKLNIKLPYTTLHAPLDIRMNALKELSKYHSYIEICGEPNMKCSGCISSRDCEILKINTTSKYAHQRRGCECLALKHELLSNRHPCAHNCLYCYWKD